MKDNFDNTLKHSGHNGGNDFSVIRVAKVEKFSSGFFEIGYFQFSMVW